MGLGWSSGEVPMSLLEQQPRRSFGVDDQPICPQCGNSMHLSRRDPHPEHGAYYERQTFSCYACKYESQRSADTSGKPYN
jgi:transposase-like protein